MREKRELLVTRQKFLEKGESSAYSPREDDAPRRSAPSCGAVRDNIFFSPLSRLAGRGPKRILLWRPRGPLQAGERENSPPYH